MNKIPEIITASQAANLIGVSEQRVRTLLRKGSIEGKQAGPFSEEEIARLICEGKVDKTTYVWRPGMPQWARAENVPEVLKIVALTPPPLPTES